MKKLILVRHAKSSWDNPDLTDFERVLNKRGIRDAQFMSELLQKILPVPDLFISSSAIRAVSTAKYFADTYDVDFENIVIDNGVYDRGSKYIINKLKKTDNTVNSIILFGHNPDITSLASYFSGQYFDNIPTCSFVGIEFPFNTWENIEEENGRLIFYEYPKKYFKKEKN